MKNLEYYEYDGVYFRVYEVPGKGITADRLDVESKTFFSTAKVAVVTWEGNDVLEENMPIVVREALPEAIEKGTQNIKKATK